MKYVKRMTVFFTALLLMLCVQAIPAQAATSLVKLTAGKTYTAYDFTRDGRKDKFYYKSSNYQADVYINGKKAAQITAGKAVNPQLYYWKVDKTNTYVLVKGASTGGWWYDAYQYKSGKLKWVYSFSAGDLTDATLQKASGKYLYMKYSSQRYGTFSLRHGKGITVKFKYKTSNGKISLASRTGTIVSGQTFKALNSFTTSNACGKSNTKGTYVQKGKTVKVKGAYLDSSGRVWYKIYCGGKSGWFVDSDSKLLK